MRLDRANAEEKVGGDLRVGPSRRDQPQDLQLVLLQQFYFLQPVIAFIGLVELGIAWSWRRRIAGSEPIAAMSVAGSRS